MRFRNVMAQFALGVAVVAVSALLMIVYVFLLKGVAFQHPMDEAAVASVNAGYVREELAVAADATAPVIDDNFEVVGKSEN